jgi:hypothetical protein
VDETLFLYVPFAHAHSFNKPLDKWLEIVTRFPKAVGHIEEAQKCLTRSRYIYFFFFSLAGVLRLVGTQIVQ